MHSPTHRVIYCNGWFLPQRKGRWPFSWKSYYHGCVDVGGSYDEIAAFETEGRAWEYIKRFP